MNEAFTKEHWHICAICDRSLVYGPMECPEFDYKDHTFGVCEECRKHEAD